jgi:ComF family protein
MHPTRTLPSSRRAIFSRVPAWVSEAIDLVFPPRCVFCRQDVDRAVAADPLAAVVCDACIEAVAADERPRCGRCGSPIAAGDACVRCPPKPWRAIAVLGGYDGPLRDAVLRGKRAAGEDGCRGLASLWLRRHGWSARGWKCDCVVPVPLHWTRRIARGSSATDTLATTIARGLGLPASRGLRRVRSTRMQNELPPEDRPRNVRGAFRCDPAVRGRRVLLVDDVVTTGSTLDACCREFLAAGAAEVFMAAMAKADRSDSLGSPAS